MSSYEIFAIPHFTNVTCPKHRGRMDELSNGLLGEKLWYCHTCDRPYRLKPSMLRVSEFDREELDRQLATQIKASQLAEGV